MNNSIPSGLTDNEIREELQVLKFSGDWTVQVEEAKGFVQITLARQSERFSGEGKGYAEALKALCYQAKGSKLLNELAWLLGSSPALKKPKQSPST